MLQSKLKGKRKIVLARNYATKANKADAAKNGKTPIEAEYAPTSGKNRYEKEVEAVTFWAAAPAS